MKSIEINKTLHQPHVLMDFDKAYVLFEGKSIVANVDEFYKPIANWITEFTSDSTKLLVFDFKLEYFNTASLKEILNILLILKKAVDNGSDVIFNWYIYDEDDDMREIADEAELLSQLVITYKTME